jgi:hypothetical protein
MRSNLATVDKDRFWSFVAKGDGCWEWTGYRGEQGYGVFSLGGKNHRAHRFSYAHNVGPVRSGQMVCHRCDNPSCVRPDHLFLGSGKDNAADCIAKGRFPFRYGLNATHCQRGHEFTPENTYTSRSGKRNCRTCKRAAERARRIPKRNPQRLPVPPLAARG